MHRVLLTWAALFTALVHSVVLRTNSRWIVDSNNARVKLRCVNWAGAGETRIPEGLHAQPVDTITSLIASGGFNCVRLTYSIDMAINPNQLVSDAFKSAASSTGQSGLNDLYNTAKAKNSFLATGTVRGAFEAVVNSLNKRGILVVLDNHTSRAQWCCSTSDGNGWWASASGYNADNSRYFDTNNWLAGLRAMSAWSKSFPNIVGLALRNELRAVGSQDGNNHADWYNYVTQGAKAVHDANPNALVVIGGVGYATDLSFIYNKPLDKNAMGLAEKLVWEFHSYSWSNSQTGNCPEYTKIMGNAAGYLLAQGKAYTAPLWLSEFGWSQSAMTDAEKKYASCLMGYMESNDADWAYWALQGSYYIREGRVNYDESFGLLNNNWSGWRNSNWKSNFGNIFQVTQGP